MCILVRALCPVNASLYDGNVYEYVVASVAKVSVMHRLYISLRFLISPGPTCARARRIPRRDRTSPRQESSALNSENLGRLGQRGELRQPRDEAGRDAVGNRASICITSFGGKGHRRPARPVAICSYGVASSASCRELHWQAATTPPASNGGRATKSLHCNSY